MTRAFLSSGDLIADRRAAYAGMLAEGGDFAGAADLMAQALELVPNWAAGLDLLGSYSERAGQLPAARAAWEALASLDPADPFGARLKLAAHGQGNAAPQTALSYVETLFDHYADRFETELLGKLSYQVPDFLLALIEQRSDGRQFGHAIDLGCGTGLMGIRLRAISRTLTGVDISSRMLAEARRKGIYDALHKADIGVFLSALDCEADLVTAADVLMYCGALQPVFAAVSRALQPGGWFAFSVEEHRGAEPHFLRPSLRYAHSEAGVRDALVIAGLSLRCLDRGTIRYDRGEPLTGLLVLASKP